MWEHRTGARPDQTRKYWDVEVYESEMKLPEQVVEEMEGDAQLDEGGEESENLD